MRHLARILLACFMLSAVAEAGLRQTSEGVWVDDFSDVVLGGWRAAGDAYALVREAGRGHLRIGDPAVDESPFVILRAEDTENWRDYAVTAEMKSAAGGWAGLLLREGADGKYEVFFNDDNHLLLRVNGRDVIAVSRGTFSADEFHTVRVVLRGTRITVSVNGEVVFSVTDETSRQGRCGLLGFKKPATFAKVTLECPLPPIDVAARRQLFLDTEHVIDTLDGAELKVHAPQLDGRKLLAADQPWETYINAYGTVFRDGDALKCYYEAYGGAENVSRCCLATSSDGLTWEKPALGLVEFDGSKDNNIAIEGRASYKRSGLYKDELRLHGGTVFKDAAPRVAAEDNAAYKFLFLGNGDVYGKYSPDGLKWMDYPKALINIRSDTQSVAFWDPWIERYVAYVRTHTRRPFDESAATSRPSMKLGGGQIKLRTVGRSTSADFVTWTPAAQVLAPPEDATTKYDYYTNAASPYLWADQAYFLFPAVLDFASDGTDVFVFTSHDGVAWFRPSAEPVIPRGEKGQWNGGQIYARPFLQRVGDELWLYYAAAPFTHAGAPLTERGRGFAMARAVWRLDGITSVSAGAKGGTMTTVPLKFAGERLVLNVRPTAPGGRVRVEILSAAGDPIAGFGPSDVVNRDGLAEVVRWKGNASVAKLAGRSVRLRFEIHNADLFALQFVEPEADTAQ